MIERVRTFALALACVVGLCGAAPVPIVTPTVGGEAWTSEGIAKLASDLDTLLANDTSLRGAHVGVYAIDTASGMPLYARAPDDEFQPASTLKLLVGSVALDTLGPAYRTRTSLVSHGTDLVLRAGGDPFLSTRDLDEAARAAAASAARPARANVSIDDRRYDTKPYPDGWTWDDFAYDYAPKISALSFEENVIQVRVSAGSGVGAPARIATSPIDAVRRASDGCPGTLETLVESTVATGAVASDPDGLDVTRDLGGCIRVGGTIPFGSPTQTIGAAVASPLAYARAYLESALRAVGVRADRIVRMGNAPDEGRFVSHGDAFETPVWQHDSLALGAYVGPRFWIPSDNLVGEMLLKEIGLTAAGAPGTTAKGVAFEKLWLQRIGVDPATVTLADGCGMSQYDRITPRDLVAILQHDWNGPNRALVLDSLPVGGARGTIEGIAESPAAGRVFAKTGSMMHVRGLAGYLATVRHGAATFAFEVDDWNGAYPALAALRARVLARIVRD